MLELDGLTRRYGDVVALDGLTFSVRPGEVFGFVGPNGAGKTTAMRIVLGVLAADAGSVRWEGRPVDEALRARFGYMPEERGLYPKMRVAEQLAYFARLHGAEPDAARAPRNDWMEQVGVAQPRRGPRRAALARQPAARAAGDGARPRPDRRSSSTSRSAAWTRSAWTS